MAWKLCDDDARAVDLLLDSAQSAQGNGGNVLTHVSLAAAPTSFQVRLVNVERLLQVLDQYPAGEPSGDLVQKTMQRLEEALVTGRVTTRPAAQAPAASDTSRPSV
jgi:hypothetical protein